MHLRSALRCLAAAGLALGVAGCNPDAKKVADHFVDAVARDDWATAYADLHPDARASTTDAEALRAQFTAGGRRLLGWYGNCGSSGELSRTAYNVTSEPRPKGAAPARVVIGVPPLDRGKCNGPLLVELKQDAARPDGAWRVRSFQWK
ncbi:MAG: hypothetical protein JNL38_09995 [Myxococcales bacterium]|jgi:hypothetical protein|nr:hypothetical protein [Myxococcales bacterium]